MESEGGFRLVSRESFLLLNNILLLVATAAVLFGTLYPLFLDALGLGKLSVGPPYFKTVFLIPMLPLLLFLGVGMHATWLSTNSRRLAQKLSAAAVIAVLAGILLPLIVYSSASVLTMIGVALGAWVIISALWDPVGRILRRNATTIPLTRAQWGMSVAHIGVGLFVLGVTVTSSFGIESDQSMRAGDTLEMAGYEFQFRGTRNVDGINYEAVEGEIEVRRNGRLLTILAPQKRVYRVQRSPMTEAAIDPQLSRDLFIALGEPLGDGAWSVRIQYKPFIRFIWLGALVMAFGGILAATDRRYRTAKATQTVPNTVQQAAESA
jgi:cytochrome c-type biogenesis protein CcmF